MSSVPPNFENAANAVDAVPSEPATVSQPPKQLVKELKSSSKLTFSGTMGKAIEQLNHVSSIDSIYTKKQSTWGCGIALGVVLTVVAFVAGVMTEGPGFFAMVVTIPGLLVSLALYFSSSALNVPNRRYEAPLKFLPVLKADIPSDREVEMDVDFRHYKDDASFKVKSVGGFFSTIVQSQYEVPWFNIKGQLYDGSKFRLKITQTVKRKEKKKRKKTKVTERFRDKYNLVLAVRPSEYPGLAKFVQVMNNSNPNVRVPISIAKVEGNRVIIQAATIPKKVYGLNSMGRDPLKTEEMPDHILQLFLACYHCLGQCRQA